MEEIHTKKVLKKYFDKILSGEKTYEVRLADWECQTGDILELVEIDDVTKQPTGRTMNRKAGAVIKTKDIERESWWLGSDIERYGYQIIALNEEV